MQKMEIERKISQLEEEYDGVFYILLEFDHMKRGMMIIHIVVILWRSLSIWSIFMDLFELS